MSAGHRDPAQRPPTREEQKQLELLLADRRFQASFARYHKRDQDHDVAFLAGSSKDGETIYFDKDFCRAIENGEITFKGKPFDPRPLLSVHEGTEGTILRGGYTPGIWMRGGDHKSYDFAHRMATLAEMEAVDAYFGKGSWKDYDKTLEPWVKPDDPRIISNPPPDILREPMKQKSTASA